MDKRARRFPMLNLLLRRSMSEGARLSLLLQSAQRHIITPRLEGKGGLGGAGFKVKGE